jgi:uncharacterized protein YjbI with pentapeptide repeats
VLSVQESDDLSTGDTVSPVSPRSKRQRVVERVFGGVAVVAAGAVVVGFGVYVVNADGAARISALFAGGLVLVGAWLLLWSYVRRPPPGQDDDFLDKFLAGAGQALLLGAVLSFGFGVVGQGLEDERAGVALRRDLAEQVRADAGGKSFSGVDLHGEWFFGLNMSEFDLTFADLTDAGLGDANLTNARLDGATLTDASLSDANLTGASLALADLTFANLTDANLTDANLLVADLTDADLTDANLTDANLAGADLTDADLAGADLTGADLFDADLTDALYDAATVWPDGFEPPPTAELVGRRRSSHESADRQDPAGRPVLDLANRPGLDPVIGNRAGTPRTNLKAAVPTSIPLIAAPLNPLPPGSSKRTRRSHANLVGPRREPLNPLEPISSRRPPLGFLPFRGPPPPAGDDRIRRNYRFRRPSHVTASRGPVLRPTAACAQTVPGQPRRPATFARPRTDPEPPAHPAERPAQPFRLPAGAADPRRTHRRPAGRRSNGPHPQMRSPYGQCHPRPHRHLRHRTTTSNRSPAGRDPTRAQTTERCHTSISPCSIMAAGRPRTARGTQPSPLREQSAR